MSEAPAAMRPEAKPLSALAVVGLLSLFSLTVYPASFDCELASTPIEQMICDSPQLSALDDELTEAYVALRDSLPVADQDALREEQHAWLRGRDACADSACVSRLSSDRIEQLRARLEPGLPAEDPVEESGGVDAVTPMTDLSVPDSQAANWPPRWLLLFAIGAVALLAFGLFIRHRRRADPDTDEANQAPDPVRVPDERPVAEKRKPFCTQCGTQLAPELKFCTNCGAKRE